MKEAQSFALSATPQRFMGSFGFGLMALGAVLASASAINADFFGAAKLPVTLAEHGEMPPRFAGVIEGKHLASMLFVGIIAVLAVNFLNLHELSAATSGGFLVVYAAVNLANVKLGSETNSWRWLSLLAALVCILALAITLYDFAANPQTRLSAGTIVAIVVLSVATEKAFRTMWPDPPALEPTDV
jgi:amino acid transporter